MCENSAVVLKQEIDAVFQENEVMVLGVDNIRRLQVSIFKKTEIVLIELNSQFFLFVLVPGSD